MSLQAQLLCLLVMGFQGKHVSHCKGGTGPLDFDTETMCSKGALAIIVGYLVWF